MSWRIIAPKDTAVQGTKVIGVDTPPFTDEVDFEGILERAFSGPAFDPWLATQPAVIVAREGAFDEIRKLMDGDWGDVPQSTLERKVMEHCLQRNAVCLRWFP